MSRAATYRDVESAEALRLVEAGEVTVVDVRTPGEFMDLGHIPGAIFLPLHWIPCGFATLPRNARPTLICCEHGIRSAQAARYLEMGGMDHLLNLKFGMADWSGERSFDPPDPACDAGPNRWILATAELLPQKGRVLDLASGAGRHALLLAGGNFEVHAIDRDAEKISRLTKIAHRLKLSVQAEVRDLETGAVDLGREKYSMIFVVNYLHRELFPAIIDALEPGGLLIYETFSVEQAKIGRPKNPDFLLELGELPALCEPLSILRSREGQFDGRYVSAVAARKNE